MTVEHTNGRRPATTVETILRFVENGGSLSAITRSTVLDGVDLHRALSEIRGRYRRGELPRKAIQQLSPIPGWEWSPRLLSFNDRVEEIKRFQAEHEHLNVPTSRKAGHRSLSVWLRNQRYRYLEGTLCVEQIRALEAIPGWDWCTAGAAPVPPAPAIQRDPGKRVRLSDPEVIESLQRFAATFGHARVPKHYVDHDFRLGQWVRIRRRQHRNGALRPELAAALSALPGWTWDPMRDRTNAGISPAAAIAFLRRYVGPAHHNGTKASGTPRQLYDVTATTLFEATRVARVVHRLRKLHNHGTLTAEETAAIEALPGWAWTPTDQKYLRDFACLAEFATTHGHVRMPHDYVQGSIHLGRFIARMRTQYASNRLCPAQVARFEAIPGWRWTAPNSRHRRHTRTQ